VTITMNSSGPAKEYPDLEEKGAWTVPWWSPIRRMNDGEYRRILEGRVMEIEEAVGLIDGELEELENR